MRARLSMKRFFSSVSAERHGAGRSGQRRRVAFAGDRSIRAGRAGHRGALERSHTIPGDLRHQRCRPPGGEAPSLRPVPSPDSAARLRRSVGNHRSAFGASGRAHHPARAGPGELHRHSPGGGHSHRPARSHRRRAHQLQHHSEPHEFSAGPLPAGSRRFPAGLDLRGQWRAPPARLGIPDAVRGGRRAAHRQSLAQLRPGDRSRRRAVHGRLHGGLRGRIRPQAGRRRRDQHVAGGAAGLSWAGGAFRRQLPDGGQFYPGAVHRRQEHARLQRPRQPHRSLLESGGAAELHQLGHHRRFFGPLRARPDAQRHAHAERPPRTFAFRDSQRATAANRGPAADGRQLRNDGHRFLRACLFRQFRGRCSRDGAGQRARLVLQPVLNSSHRVPAQWLSRGLFQGQCHAPARQASVEGGRRIGQHLPLRELPRRHYRSLAVRSRHAVPFRLLRPASRDRAGRVRPGPGPPGQLDAERRLALGPLPTAGQPERREPAPLAGALFSVRGHGSARLLRPHFPDAVFR